MFLKIFLLGAAKVGKSSLLSRFCGGRSFDAGYSETVTADFNGTKVRLSNGLHAVLQIWDLPGNPAHLAKLDREPRTYWSETHVCVLVCDMCSRDSFVVLEQLRQEFLDSFAVEQRSSLSFVLLINKAEPTHAKKQQVFASDVLAWCARHNIRHFYETSALTDTNVLIALLNITQLASEMDMVRRGIKVQVDAAELARREAEEAAAAAEALRIATETAAAAEAARIAEEERVAAETAARVAAERQRERDFESRWTAQKAEEEAARAAIATERARVAARRREEAERRKKEVATSAYGAFKQRPHRLSVALIQQHAQQATPDEAVDPAELGISPQLIALAATSAVGNAIPEETLKIHRPGTLPASLHAPPAGVRPAKLKRPSILGLGAGAMLRQALEGKSSLDGIAETSGPIGGPTPPPRALSVTDKRAHGATPTPPSTGGSGRAGKRAAAAATAHRHSQSQHAALANSGPAPAPARPASGADSRPIATHEPEVEDLTLSRDLSDATTGVAALSVVADDGGVPEEDANETVLLDRVAPLVSWTRRECLTLLRLFGGGASAELRLKSFRRVWSRLSHCNPAYIALSSRFFAALDLRRCGRVAFEEFARALDTLFRGDLDARAQLVFRIVAFEACPLVTPKETSTTTEATEGQQSSTAGNAPPLNTPRAPSPPPPPAVLSKNTFTELHRTRLHGRERFVHDMYDDDEGDADEAPRTAESSELDNSGFDDASSPNQTRAFVTRAELTKASLLLIEGLPAFRALATTASSTSSTNPTVASPSAAAAATAATVVATRASFFVRTIVDSWFESVGRAHADTFTRDEWLDAVRARPALIQPYLPTATPTARASAKQ